VDCVSLGRLVEMKVHYRKPTLLELMDDAISVANSKKPIKHFELNSDELSSCYSSFDKINHKDNVISYSYKGIPIKVVK
jgi:hypothetical protein